MHFKVTIHSDVSISSFAAEHKQDEDTRNQRGDVGLLTAPVSTPLRQLHISPLGIPPRHLVEHLQLPLYVLHILYSLCILKRHWCISNVLKNVFYLTFYILATMGPGPHGPCLNLAGPDQT